MRTHVMGVRRAILLATAASAMLLVHGASAASPSVVTGAVSAVGGTTATLNGTVNPGGTSTTWWFEYGKTVAYGSKTGDTSAGSGTGTIAVSRNLSGLELATTYHYRLVARSGSGTTTGGDGLFTTSSPPLVTTAPATVVTPSSANLGGSVSPNGQPTTWYVEFGTSTSYGTKTAAFHLGTTTGTKAVAASVTGLAAGRTYHFRLVAANAAGTVRGEDATFLTAEPPAVTTWSATSVSASGARLNGRVDPNGRATTYRFEYGTSTSYGATTSPSGAGSGSSWKSVSKSIGGLKAGTTYHFRIVAVSDAGTTTGGDRSFTTQSAPTVVTGQATSVGPTSANLGGTVNPNGRSASWYVEYGTSTRYGSRTSSRGVGSGATTLSVVTAVAKLKPGVIYHFRLVATSSLGTTRGGDVTFSTVGSPTATTGGLTFTTLSLTSVRVNGVVSPRGLPTTWWFEYGRTRDYGRRTAVSGVSGTADVRVALLLSRLIPGVRWHYRLVVRSEVGTSYGLDTSFATPPRPRDSNGRLVKCTIVGTQASEVIRGTRRNDVICGLGGNDTIFGGGGADVIYGGPGRDAIVGGPGRDVLRGGPGNDLFKARDGYRDVVDGGAGRDTAILDRTRDRVISVERRSYTP